MKMLKKVGKTTGSVTLFRAAPEVYGVFSEPAVLNVLHLRYNNTRTEFHKVLFCTEGSFQQCSVSVLVNCPSNKKNKGLHAQTLSATHLFVPHGDSAFF